MSALDRANHAFLDDLSGAVAAWREVWWLPVISVLLGASVWASGAERLLEDTAENGGTAAGGGQFALVLLVVSILELGWFGTEREVYRRVWARDGDPARGLFRLTLRYVGPFLRLGLLVGWPLLLAPVAVDTDDPAGLATGIYALTLTVYVATTFATPELAYRTRSATTAVGSGLAALRTHARSVWWHALVPPILVVTLSAAAGTRAIPTTARAVIGALATLAALATKGAIARRWLILQGDPGQPRG